MINLYKYICRFNIREGKELFKLNNHIGTISNGYKLAMNTFRLD